MKMKRFGYVLLLVLLAACALVITSCNKNKPPEHTHSYTATVTEPTCTEKGYTTHKCSCGDSYVDTYVNAKGHALETVSAKESDCQNQGYSEYKKCKNCSYTEGKTILPLSGHDYASKIAQYPTAFEAGVRELKCSVCGDTVVEPIDALSVSMPDVAEVLYMALNGTKYTLDASELELIYINEANGVETASEKIALKIAELVLDGTGEVAVGHLKLEIGRVKEENGAVAFESAIACYVYVNGDAVSAEVTPPNQPKATYDYSLNEEFYKALADSLGVDVEDLNAGLYILSELQNYLPVLAGLVEELPKISESFIEELNALAALVGEEIFTAETADDGSTTYTLNIAALKEFLAVVEGKTVGEILDSVYGEGTGDALLAFISALPDKTVGEIVDAAIALTENYEIPVEDTYYLVNFIVYNVTDNAKFDIETLIDTYYEWTVVELIAELSEMPDEAAAEFKASFKEQLVGMATMILGSTVDELFNTFAPSDPEADPISLIENIKALIDMVDGMVSLDIVVDVNGAFDHLDFTADLAGAVLSVDAMVVDDIVYVNVDLAKDETDLLDLTVAVDTVNQAFNVELVVRDDRYVIKPMVDIETGETKEVSEYLDFGEVLVLSMMGSKNPVEVRLEVSAYDTYVGALVEELSFGVIYKSDLVGIKINDFMATLNCDTANEAKGSYVLAVMDGQNEVLTATLNYTKTIDENGVVTNVAVEMDLINAEDEDLLDLILYVEPENDYVEFGATISGYSYDEETDTDVFGVQNFIVATLENVDGNMQLFVGVTDKDAVELFKATFVFSQVIDGDKESNKVEYEITLVGETVVGEASFDVTTLENGGLVERTISAFKDAEEVFFFSDVITVTENGFAYEIEASESGDILIDGEVSAEYVSEEGKETVTFDFDLVKFVLSTMWETDPETEELVENVASLMGAGTVTVTVER